MLEWTEVKVLDGLDLLLVASASGIRAIQFGAHPAPEGQRNDGNPLLMEAARQLRAYFDGALREFSLPLDLQGTEFQKRVWGQVAAIPYGETRTYKEIAEHIGKPRSARAVGRAEATRCSKYEQCENDVLENVGTKSEEFTLCFGVF